MLVLTRKINETIFIGEDIRIIIVGWSQGQVKLGIACPEALPVMRGELGGRTKRLRWPNLTPDEMSFLLIRYNELKEWWTQPNATDRKYERGNLESFIHDLEKWALAEYLERYARWYQEEDAIT